MATYNIFCTKCGITVDTEEDLNLFPKDKSKPTGYRNQCKNCRSIIREKWKSKNLEKEGKRRADGHMRRRYGITLDEYDEMFEQQNGKCAICGTREKAKGKTRMNIDHCHTTGKVRALLCNNCNSGIGKFKEDINIMSNAISYIIKHKGL